MISSHSDDYGKTDFANLWIRPERGTRATTVAAICYSFYAETLSPAAYSKCQILCQSSILTLSVACRSAQKLSQAQLWISSFSFLSIPSRNRKGYHDYFSLFTMWRWFRKWGQNLVTWTLEMDNFLRLRWARNDY